MNTPLNSELFRQMTARPRDDGRSGAARNIMQQVLEQVLPASVQSSVLSTILSDPGKMPIVSLYATESGIGISTISARDWYLAPPKS
jgi:hypothetical protein